MSRTGSRRRFALIGLTVALALVLTSCFGEDEGAGESPTTTERTVAPPPATDPTTTTPGIVTPTTRPPVTSTTATPDPVTPTTATTVATQPPDVGEDGIVLYTVEPGDTLFSIAQRFGVTLDALTEANNISNPDVIFEGDTLTIPLAGG